MKSQTARSHFHEETRIAVVVQRFGRDIVGGAEQLAFELVGRMAKKFNYKIDVYTTTASDYRTWASDLKQGQETLSDQITIKRFAVIFPRVQRLFQIYSDFFFKVNRRRQFLPAWVYLWFEKLWFILQGPYCPGLIKDLQRNEPKYRKIILFTYLYYPTHEASKIMPGKCILIPTTHDEQPFYTHTVASLFKRVPKLFALTAPERDFIERTLKVGYKTMIAGYGIEEPILSVNSCDNSTSPHAYFIYLGRISRGKHVDRLINYFQSYCQKSGDEKTKLILAGKREKDFTLPNTSQIEFLGYVSEEEKQKLIQQATALINPSPMESLSIIVLEAMISGVPVLVNYHCDVLRFYAESTRTVMSFKDENDFCEKMRLMLSQNWHSRLHAQGLLEESREWAKKTFSWESVLDQYHQAVLN